MAVIVDAQRGDLLMPPTSPERPLVDPLISRWLPCRSSSISDWLQKLVPGECRRWPGPRTARRGLAHLGQCAEVCSKTSRTPASI